MIYVFLRKNIFIYVAVEIVINCIFALRIQKKIEIFFGFG